MFFFISAIWRIGVAKFILWMNRFSLDSTSSGGVVVFFVVSGFLNLMVAMSIARRCKDKEYYSWKSARVFLFRRFMHLGPNLYFAVIVALLVGCTSSIASLSEEFCTPCKSYWWMDYLFLDNYAAMIFGTACFNSTWTVSAQMQLYVLGILINVIYFRHPAAAFLAATILSIISIIIRTKLVFIYGESPSTFSSHVYTPAYCRIDSYMIGMMLWMVYEQVLKPIHTKSYIPKHLRDQYLPAKKNTTLSTTRPAPSEGVPAVAVPVGSSGSYGTGTAAMDDKAVQQFRNTVQPKEATVTPPPRPQKTFWEEHVEGLVTWYQDQFKNFHLFHKYATWTHILTLYTLYPTMAFSMYLGLNNAITRDTDDYLWTNWSVFSDIAQSSMIFGSLRNSYSLTVVALGTMGLLFFALEKVVLWPWSYVCRWWIWYPVGMLSYTGYLLSILTGYVFFATKADMEGASSWNVSSDTEGWLKYNLYFWAILALNLIGATMMSFLIERPLMNLSKAIDV